MRIGMKGALAVLVAVSMMALGACGGGKEEKSSTALAGKVAAVEVEEAVEEAAGGEEGGTETKETLSGPLAEADMVGTGSWSRSIRTTSPKVLTSSLKTACNTSW